MGLSWQQGSLVRNPTGVFLIAGLVSFYPEKRMITIDGERLEPVPGQTVLSHGPDRNLNVDEIGGIQLAELPAPAGA